MRKILIGICLLIIPFFGFAEEDVNYIKEFLKANMLINDGNIKDALPILEKINKNVDDEAIVIKLAEVYIALGKKDEFDRLMDKSLKKEVFSKSSTIRRFYANTLATVFNKTDEAINQMKKLVEIDPSKENLLLLTKLCETKKDFSCAISAMNKIIEKEPTAENYYKRGLYYYNLELKPNALRDFEASLKLEKNFMPMLMISEIYIQDNNTDLAIKYLEDAVKEKAGLVIPEYRLAELYRVKGDFQKSVKYFEMIADKVSDREKLYVYKQIAGIYFELKDYDSAFVWFSRLNEVDKNDQLSYYYLGVISELKKDFQQAVKYYKELTLMDPRHTFGKKRLAYAYMKIKDYPNALSAIESIDKDERDVDYFRIKALIYAEKKDTQNQLATLIDGLSKNPNSEDLLFDIADYYEKVKQYDKVEYYLKKLLSLNPNNASALNYLGYLYAEQNKNLVEAYNMIEKALKLEPDNSAYLDSMAWVLYRLKRYQEAFEYQKKALKRSPEEKEMIDHMKEILKALGINKSIEDILKEVK
ncbi:tetratricopeptide repeat protein [Calditerrivibrio nitroreducens]|uniref:Tetratricopeptide TPR_1 repeat-containing protein n=1 Tax=Calditerrivibrio nitroreducens TaxID=477976 RepID=A0A2J6WRN3_9BACT|nr:MAG: hypothetical protein C0187_00130 [Calditerrivibrio nitroreducens]